MTGRRLAFWTVAATFSLYLFAAAAPSPLYAVYAARWHFSTVVLTEVFAIYALALLAALLLTGSLSDTIGRRPVILAGIAVQLASMAVFVTASGIGSLFVARTLQGIATGIATSAMAAALVDLQPRERPTLAPLVNSVAPVGGLAAGALGSAALVQYGPSPLQLVYWLLVAGFVVAGLGIALAPEPAPRAGNFRLLPRISVDPEVRPAFLAAVPSLVAAWAVGGFYLSLGPSLALQLAGSHDRVVGGLAIFTLAGVGTVCVIALQSWPPRRAMLVGGAGMIVGLGLTAVAIGARSGAGFFLATAVTGVGFGLGWLGVLRTLITLAAPQARGALLAAIYIVSYVSFAVPAVVAGYLVSQIGLHDASLWYAAAVGLIALVGLGGTLLVARPQAVPAPA